MRADVEQYSELRKQGLTYREIGERVGLPPHQIRYALENFAETQFKRIPPMRCIYEGLRNWLNENECNISELARRIYGDGCTAVATRRYYRRLCGKHRLTIDDIDDILQLTGCTYEELFGMKGVTT